ncbi:MAG: cyclic di-GMP phosphodiesterase [Actinomycetota bacterium]|jgi:putative two-component system response regulator|nr:cyclic di-GMP phosphodiesterase [Actinomycetota bacterium]
MAVGTLTVLFTDLVSSTEMLGALGDVAGEQVLVEHLSRLREVLVAHEGKEVKPTGDGLMVAFNTAGKALECAVAMQQRIRWDNENERDVPIGLRIGLHAGEAELRDGDYYGTWVVVAKRLCDAAGAGQILASSLVHGLGSSRSELRFRGLDPVRLKGVAEPVVPYEVLWEPITELPPASTAKILVVEDQETNLLLLEQLLVRNGFPNVKLTADSRQALPLFLSFQPDLVLLDLQMPHLDGFAVLEQLQSRIRPDVYLPVLILTADISPDARTRALAMGARDFLTKPFDPTEVLLRIKNLLETRALHLELQNQNEALEGRVHERTGSLEDAQNEILDRLALAAGYRDDSSGDHGRGVGELAAALAKAAGVPLTDADLYRRAAALHDVGKLAIPDAILLKPGPLTEEERAVVKEHTTIGSRILSGGSFPLLLLAEEIALTHHERWDGSGYAGLAGEAIPLAGRIVAIAEVFDTLIHARPYKDAWPRAEAVAEIEAQKGRQFDPSLVDSFLEVMAASEA